MNQIKPFKILFICFLLFSQISPAQHFHRQMHKPPELTITDPPNVYNDYFAGAGACMLCHNSMADNNGNSVALVDDWRSTMMANAARDPFWQAKVSHEIMVNPHLKNEIESVCTRCHAPMGNINAIYNGEEYFTIGDMKNDTLGMDGVSCTVCHQITPESMGNSSGNFIIGSNQQIWGPYQTPFANPMIVNTGYTPVYSEHIKDSRLCGSCHTLITNSVDLDGVPTGEEFVEQAIYQEWKNSIYSNNGTTCYNCHVPEIEDVVKISSRPPWLDGRTPFGKHHFQGANTFMLKILKSNIDELNLTADANQFDSTINRTLKNVQLLSLEANLSEIDRTPDSLYIDLAIENLAGHKLPGGYPSRRIFVEFIVTNEINDTIFHSGKMNDQFDLVEEDEGYETHYNFINQENQVQIYEMVMGDVENNVTTVLERAYLHLKDNRIPPKGFTSEHISYDTTQIVGSALEDINFNKIGQEEGTATDVISYNIPISENNLQTIIITSRIYYQSVTNRWLADMFSHSTDDINLFKNLYQNADKQAVLVNETSYVSLPASIFNNHYDQVIIYPNPTSNNFSISELKPGSQINIYSMSGEYINWYDMGNNIFKIDSSSDKGIYLLSIKSPNGEQFTRKLLVN